MSIDREARGKLARGYRRRSAVWAGGGVVLWCLLVPGALATAPTLNLFKVAGFPLGYFMAAQGGLLLMVGFVALVVARQERTERRAMEATAGGEQVFSIPPTQ